MLNKELERTKFGDQTPGTRYKNEILTAPLCSPITLDSAKQ